MTSHVIVDDIDDEENFPSIYVENVDEEDSLLSNHSIEATKTRAKCNSSSSFEYYYNIVKTLVVYLFSLAFLIASLILCFFTFIISIMMNDSGYLNINTHLLVILILNGISGSILWY